VFTAEETAVNRLRVTGIDIDPGELARAPAGTYSQVVASAIEDCKGPPVHDFVLAQSVLERVRHGTAAAAGISALAKPAASIVTFCPCKRALFARLNRVLPESLTRVILFAVFPQTRQRQGCPAYYAGCSPSHMT